MNQELLENYIKELKKCILIYLCIAVVSCTTSIMQIIQLFIVNNVIYRLFAIISLIIFTYSAYKCIRSIIMMHKCKKSLKTGEFIKVHIDELGPEKFVRNMRGTLSGQLIWTLLVAIFISLADAGFMLPAVIILVIMLYIDDKVK